MKSRRITTVAATVALAAALAMAMGQAPAPDARKTPAAEQPRTGPSVPSRAAYDEYLWQIAHHPDVYSAFEYAISPHPDKPQPRAWHLNRMGLAYYSREQFRKWVKMDIEEWYGKERVACEFARREQLAEKLDHSLWELFHALILYNREVFLTDEHIRTLAEEVKKRVPRDRVLEERLKVIAVGDPLPKPRSRP
jgi:hypothetical protein